MFISAAEINKLDALSRGSILYGNASAATTVLTKGGAATVLTSDGTDVSWAAAAAGGIPDVVFPSNWASPNNTYTSSGTWSKGSLADDDYVWIYLMSSGGGGGSYTNVAEGGNSGAPMFLYGKAGVFNGAAYVIGAQKAGKTSGAADSYVAANPGNVSSFTLSTANGGTAFTTGTGSGDGDASNYFFSVSLKKPDAIDLAAFNDFTINAVITSTLYTFADLGLPTGVTGRFFVYGKVYNDAVAGAEHNIFGGGNGGGGEPSSVKTQGTSEFAGAGGAVGAQGAAGAVPGGGGGGTFNASNTGGAGGAGNLRVYHV